MKKTLNEHQIDSQLIKNKKTKDVPESTVLIEVLKALKAHPEVAWCERVNSGATRIGSRFIRFGWRGCPDVLGQLQGGRLLGVEVKSRTGQPSLEQLDFLELIRNAGGRAFIARGMQDVINELGPSLPIPEITR
jgi:hypothetical protein